ncbi:hypothetical protein AFAE65S_04150 [Alcaligenes phenolicus]|jgi:hypothetical protein|nr:Uncharacterised protein [Alcaligenes faecalis subsp. faecalis]
MYQQGLACIESSRISTGAGHRSGCTQGAALTPFDVFSFGQLLATRGVVAELGIDTCLSADRTSAGRGSV